MAEQETVFVLVMGMVGAMGGAARVVADWRVTGGSILGWGRGCMRKAEFQKGVAVHS